MKNHLKPAHQPDHNFHILNEDKYLPSFLLFSRTEYLKWNAQYQKKRNSIRFGWSILCISFIYTLLVIPKFAAADSVINTLDFWKNEVSLEENRNFVIQWTPDKNRIIFRVSARTRGYIGIGFHSKPKMHEADIVVGWVHSGKIYLQDRYGIGNEAPSVDRHQDWDLIGGLENDTHTVLTMARQYFTCDPHDYSFTNDTLQLLWAYHPDDPVDPESPKPRIHYHGLWRRGVVSLLLLQRASQQSSTRMIRINHPKGTHPESQYKQQSLLDLNMHKWSLIGSTKRIGPFVDSVHWCQLFQRPKLSRKHHVIQYEPVLNGADGARVHHMMVYECILRSPREDEILFVRLSKLAGGVCGTREMQPLIVACNHVVVAWALGSQGVWLPQEAGYPLLQNGPNFYMLETHYNMSGITHVNDSSGIIFHHTPILRESDAGVLSVGLHPNWKHIIPPGQPSVVSEGHCVPECTQNIFPSKGISVFGVMFHTHLLGRRVRLRHIRGRSEFQPIASDSNYDFTYQEYRSLQKPRVVLPGDHMVTECVYNSQNSSSITLGGFKTREEMCLSFVFYYPKIDLSFCHSKPSLGTVLLSLGIQELSDQSKPITIRLPAELAGKSLKWRLQNYDWENHFEHFQTATHNGTFNVVCRSRTVQSILDVDYNYPNISKPWVAVDVCKSFREKDTSLNPRDEARLGGEGDSVASQDGDGAPKLIERLDVDPAGNFDVFMPVIGVEETQGDQNDGIGSPTTSKGVLVSLEEEFEREMGLDNPLDPVFHDMIPNHESSGSSCCSVKSVVQIYITLFVFIKEIIYRATLDS